jgi:hypothetical protein
MASPAYLRDDIVYPSHPKDFSTYYMDYISLCQLTHTLYEIYTEKKSNQNAK